MLPKAHILLGGIFSIISYLLFPITAFQASLVFLSSVLIDVDHYIWYVQRKKDDSLKKAYIFFKALKKLKKRKRIMMAFHTIEFLIFVAVLSYFFPFFLFILSGMLFHSILDAIDMNRNNELNLREFSLVRYLVLKHKNPSYYF